MAATSNRAGFIRSAMAIAAVLLSSAVARAQVLTFNTTAGYAGRGHADGGTNNAQFYLPAGAAFDSAGNLYVADSGNNTIRKITGAGLVTTLAGSPGVAGSANGAGTNALFNQPIGVAVDAGGNIYVSDSGNDTIRKITSDGTVSTIAGAVKIAGSADGSGTNALFSQPQGLAVDALTNLYVADYGNHTIRLITPSLAVTTYAGTPGVFGSLDATGTNALFYQPQGVAVDANLNVYVTDTANDTVRMIDPAQVVTTIAGSAGNPGASNALRTNALFYQPEGIAVDSATNIYVADYFNDTIRKISASGQVTTLAGSPGLAGSADGTKTQARFWNPQGLAVDASGNIYVADSANGTIREVSPVGAVSTFAGSPSAGSADGSLVAARFNLPMGSVLDTAGNVYVADSVNSTIRKITTGGVVSTLAGSAGKFGAKDASGTNATFNGPRGLAIDGYGSFYVADTLNDTIRKISTFGDVSIFTGYTGGPGSADGMETNALFNQPQGVAVDQANNLIYVADSGNNTIRRITSDGQVTTLAGLANTFGSVDGTNSAARFNSPRGLAVDANGNIFVADYYNDQIREVTPDGTVTTLAGAAGVWGSADGTNGAARFFQPEGVAVDGSGNVYVADSGNHTIRVLSPVGTNWVVTTAAGLANHPGSANGQGSTARFNLPSSIAFDAAGDAYVADAGNNTVRLSAMATLDIPISGVSVTPRPTSAVLTWFTGSPATTQVAYGTTPDLGATTTLDANLVTSHGVLLTGLASNTLYYYQLNSTASDGIGASVGTFMTGPNIVLQATDATYAGVWLTDSSAPDRYSQVYRYAPTTPAEAAAVATFAPMILAPGQYDVYFWYSEGPNRSTMAPVTLVDQTGSVFDRVDETQPGGRWTLVAANQTFAAGTNGYVNFGNTTGEGNTIVIADAVMFSYAAGQDLPVNGKPPAWWLNFYYGTTNVNSGSIGANGYSVLGNYILGFSPLDPTAKLAFNLAPVPGGLQASFAPALNDRTYQLQSSPKLLSPVWSNVPNTTATVSNGQGFITNTNANTATQLYYRLSVRLTP
jgi:sugar lactone lactonase YvrE